MISAGACMHHETSCGRQRQIYRRIGPETAKLTNPDAEAPSVRTVSLPLSLPLGITGLTSDRRHLPRSLVKNRLFAQCHVLHREKYIWLLPARSAERLRTSRSAPCSSTTGIPPSWRPRRPDSGVKAWHPATCARRNVECDVSRRRVPAGNKPARQPILVMLQSKRMVGTTEKSCSVPECYGCRSRSRCRTCPVADRKRRIERAGSSSGF